MINKDTKLFFSVSSKPGNFGATLYNAAFQDMGINAIYKPLKLPASHINAFDQFLKSLKIIGASGLSVSMPFKKVAAESPLVYSGGSSNINTILFYDSTLWGSNTDMGGFARTFKPENEPLSVIYGSGAMADSIRNVLEVGLCSKTITVKKGEENKLQEIEGYNTLINCTPVGMKDIEDNVFTEEIVQKYQHIVDVVVSVGDTNLITLAKKYDKAYTTGAQISLEQLCRQFTIYTEHEAPRTLFVDKLKECGYIKH